MAVTSKKWRLCVTPFGDTVKQHELSIDAANWMSALREGRRKLGENGGFPVGASCTVSPDGSVTIHDADGKRTFVLTPTPTSPAPSDPPNAPPRSSQALQSSRAHEASEDDRHSHVSQLDQPETSEPHTDRVDQDSSRETESEQREPDHMQEPRRAQPPSTPDGAPDTDRTEPQLELLFSRDEEPTSDNPLTYRERAYFSPQGMSSGTAEAQLRGVLAGLQHQLSEAAYGKFVHLCVFDHRWVEAPERPPLVALEWRDWRGEPSIEYPATEPRPRNLSRLHAEPDDRLAYLFEALHELALLQTPHEALSFVVDILDKTVPSAAISGCLYDINTDELRFVAVSGLGAEALRGTALRRNLGLFARATRVDHGALVIPSVRDVPDFDPAIDGREGLQAENLLLRPVTREGHLLGVLQFINRATGSFSAPDVNLVNYTAERLAEFLSTAVVHHN